MNSKIVGTFTIRQEHERLQEALRDSRTQTPMSDADFIELCGKGEAQKVEDAIIYYGANVNAKDANDWTALMIASIRGHTKTVSVLMKYGADVNTKNEDGMTALMMASMCGYYATPEAILKHGVDVNVTDNDGNTALYWALWDGHRETAELLRRYGAKR